MRCDICGSSKGVENHHALGGRHNREISDKYPETQFNLCSECHRGTNGVHGKNGGEFNKLLKRMAQVRFEDARVKEGMTPEEAMEFFIKTFGQNYL